MFAKAESIVQPHLRDDPPCLEFGVFKNRKGTTEKKPCYMKFVFCNMSDPRGSGCFLLRGTTYREKNAKENVKKGEFVSRFCTSKNAKAEMRGGKSEMRFEPSLRLLEEDGAGREGGTGTV